VVLQVASGLCDVAALRVFVAANKKENQPVLFFGKIDTIAWSAVDPQFPNAIAKMFVVAKIFQACTVKSDPNPCPAIYVAQGIEPFPERRDAVFFLVIVNLVWEYLYSHTLAYKLQIGNGVFREAAKEKGACASLVFTAPD